MVNYVTHNKSKAIHANQSYRKGPTRGKARGRRDYSALLRNLNGWKLWKERLRILFRR